jgi:hypothetical protein
MGVFEAMELTRYWITFEPITAASFINQGCGVTALGKSDALTLLQKALDHELPPITAIIENVDVRTLDQGHVIPNMGSPSERGVWFPRL